MDREVQRAIADTLKIHHFQSEKELEHTLPLYIELYNNYLFQANLNYRKPLNRYVLLRRSRSVEVLR